MTNDEDPYGLSRFNIRGVGATRRFVGTQKDPDGKEINVYEVEDNEWGTAVGPDLKTEPTDRDYWRHTRFHSQATLDPACPYCQRSLYGER